MTDILIIGAAIVGMIVALVWRGIVPYLMKRKEAEEAGLTPPPFSTTYITTFVIAIVGGLVSIMMVGNELENQLTAIQSPFTAMGIGLTFTYTILSGFNALVDLKSSKMALESKLPAEEVKKTNLERPS